MTARVNWGAIFAGAFIGMAGVVFFSLFALAIGINGVSLVQPVVNRISLGAAIYAIATSMIAFALGGYCTAKLAELREAGPACMHALAAFSLAGSLVPMLFTRALFIGSPGYAVVPSPGIYFEPGLAWSVFLSFALAAVACCAGGVQASYSAIFRLSRIREDARRRAA